MKPASTKEVDVTDNPIEYLPDDEPDFEDDFRWARRQPAYWAEKLKLDVADGIAAELERQQVSRAELARRMGTSAPFITKIPRGHHNWSLETLAKAGAALGQQWLLVSAPLDAPARVFARLEFPGVRGVIGGSADEEGLLEGDWSPAAGGTADSTAAEPAYDTSVTAFEGDLNVVPQHLRRGGDDDRHQLILSVAFLPREGAETQLPYHVEMKGRAFFHFNDPDLPDVEKSRMIKLNGASILFGLLRAEVAHVTALGRYGPMLLPAVNLMEAFRARSREPAENIVG